VTIAAGFDHVDLYDSLPSGHLSSYMVYWSGFLSQLETVTTIRRRAIPCKKICLELFVINYCEENLDGALPSCDFLSFKQGKLDNPESNNRTSMPGTEYLDLCGVHQHIATEVCGLF